MRALNTLALVESAAFLSYSDGAHLQKNSPRSPMQVLESFLSGRWSRGEGVETTLVDPLTSETLATASARGLDLAGALAFARREGQGALRAMGYAARAKLVGAVADVLVANRA